MDRPGQNIVVIGGGTGSSVTLRGLKGRGFNLTAIVTAFDSGGSSGKLRDEFGHLSLGDIRQCLVAMAEESEETEAFRLAAQYRFSDDSSLHGHNLGNLFLSALTVMHSDIEAAVQMMSRMLRIRGQVVPVSLDPADLCAELVDGSVLRGEATIDLRRFDPPPIRRVYLDGNPGANERALEAIRSADAIVLGPGDLYTSILPNLLVRGMVDAVHQSNAKTIFVCNLMTKHGETDGFAPSDFVREVSTYLGAVLVDAVLINSQPIPREVREVYAAVKAVPVELTDGERERVAAWSRQQVLEPLSQVMVPDGEDELRVRHDPGLLARAIERVLSPVHLDAPYTETGTEIAQFAD